LGSLKSRRFLRISQLFRRTSYFYPGFVDDFKNYSGNRRFLKMINYIN